MAADGEYAEIECIISGAECIGYQVCSTCIIAHTEERDLKKVV